MSNTRLPRIIVIASVLAAFVFAGTASSAHAEYPDYVKSACKQDFKKYCPSYAVGSSQLRQCMRGVANDLSSRCVDALERNGEKRRKS